MTRDLAGSECQTRLALETRKQVLVTVIIPTYNSGRTVESCIRSVLDQSIAPTQVLVIDRYSSDATPTIATRLGVELVQGDYNASVARQVGLARSTGKFVLAVDSDMILQRGVLKDCLRLASIGFDPIAVPEVSIGSNFWARCLSFMKNTSSTFEIPGLDFIPRWYSIDTLQRAGGWDPNIFASEDQDLYFRVASQVGSRMRVGITESCVFHDEGDVSLAEQFRKMRSPFYGGTVRQFESRYPHFRRQALKRTAVRYLRNWRVYTRHPCLTTGGALVTLTRRLGFEAGRLASSPG